jgi:hypothetical protein
MYTGGVNDVYGGRKRCIRVGVNDVYTPLLLIHRAEF